MYFFSSKTLFVFLPLMLSLSLFNIAEAQDKLLLSEEIRQSIDTEGVEAAKEKFISMDPSEREQYEVDTEGISELTNAYLEEGNMEALIAISEISGIFMQDAVAKSMEQYEAEMETMEEMGKQHEAEREQENIQRERERIAERQQTVVERQGQPRR